MAGKVRRASDDAHKRTRSKKCGLDGRAGRARTACLRRRRVGALDGRRTTLRRRYAALIGSPTTSPARAATSLVVPSPSTPNVGSEPGELQDPMDLRVLAWRQNRGNPSEPLGVCGVRPSSTLDVVESTKSCPEVDDESGVLRRGGRRTRSEPLRRIGVVLADERDDRCGRFPGARVTEIGEAIACRGKRRTARIGSPVIFQVAGSGAACRLTRGAGASVPAAVRARLPSASVATRRRSTRSAWRSCSTSRSIASSRFRSWLRSSCGDRPQHRARPCATTRRFCASVSARRGFDVEDRLDPRLRLLRVLATRAARTRESQLHLRERQHDRAGHPNRLAVHGRDSA